MLSDRNFSPVLAVVQSFQSPSQHPGQHRALQCGGPPSQPRLPGCRSLGLVPPSGGSLWVLPMVMVEEAASVGNGEVHGEEGPLTFKEKILL